ncbi:MAG TPA: hypothetical protein VFJ21_09475, partial [Mycobacteriales bacterium]|nr:hypothetical protein [Mycobacteriales bacterium]
MGAAQAAVPTQIPSDFFTVVDSGGVNDVGSQQRDLTQMGRDDKDPSVYKLFWSWDSTDLWTGAGQTGDACALFDSNGDGKVNYAICAQISNPNGNTGKVTMTANSPTAWSCNDSKNDRCAGPVALAFTSSDVMFTPLGSPDPSGDLTTATDPFLGGSNYPNDATVEAVIKKSFINDAEMVNVCSYPSIANGVNNDPGDCIVNPGAGFLVIEKTANGGTASFPFAVSPNPGASPYSITPNLGTDPKTGSTTPISAQIGTYGVSESVPSGWLLNGQSCTLEDASPTGTVSGTGVSGVVVESGRITTCSFEDTKAAPALSLTKTPTPKTYDAVGDSISYSLVATNSGNVTLSSVSISDPKLGTLTGCTPTAPATLAPGATLTCTGSYTITQGDLDAGHVDNTATATGTFNSNAVTAQASARVAGNQSPGIAIAKSAAPTTYSGAGASITYTYVVSNTGNVTLTGPVTVSDDKIGNPVGTAFQCSGVDLAPGGSVTCTAPYVTTNGDVTAGKVTNMATATAGGITSQPATATVTYTAPPPPPPPSNPGIVVLSLAKTAIPVSGSVVQPGQTINYTVTVKNSGNADAPG